MDDLLQADLFLSPAVAGGPDRHPTMSADIPARAGASFPTWLPSTSFALTTSATKECPRRLGGADARIAAASRKLFVSFGRSSGRVFRQLLGMPTRSIVSEPFANKHGVQAGDVTDA